MQELEQEHFANNTWHTGYVRGCDVVAMATVMAESSYTHSWALLAFVHRWTMLVAYTFILYVTCWERKDTATFITYVPKLLKLLY